jgi:hypothetical protein
MEINFCAYTLAHQSFIGKFIRLNAQRRAGTAQEQS